MTNITVIEKRVLFSSFYFSYKIQNLLRLLLMGSEDGSPFPLRSLQFRKVFFSCWKKKILHINAKFYITFTVLFKALTLLAPTDIRGSQQFLLLTPQISSYMNISLKAA